MTVEEVGDPRKRVRGSCAASHLKHGDRGGHGATMQTGTTKAAKVAKEGVPIEEERLFG